MLFRAMMSLMYFACLRIGEVAYSDTMDHVLTLPQIEVQVDRNSGQAQALVIHFKSYKHSKQTNLPSLNIQAEPGKLFCPVQAVTQYLKVRPPSMSGAIFLDKYGENITRSGFVVKLKSLVSMSRYCNLRINSHSFRVGRTTDMVMSGNYSDLYIQQIGRWSSEAYRRYVRPVVICPKH